MEHYYSLASHFKNDLITAVYQRVITTEVKTNENASGALDKDRTNDVSSVSTSRVMWRNLGGPSPI